MTKKIKKSQLPEKSIRKIHWGKIFWYLFLGVILVLFIVNNTRKEEGPYFQYPPNVKKNLHTNEPVGKNFPPAYNFELNSLDGKSVKLSDFRGKVIVLDFWATWCPPCRKGIPDLVDIQKSIDGVQIIGITVDRNPKEVVPDFIKEYNINYPILIGNEEVYKNYGGIEAIPTTFIIDKNGRIINKHVGLVSKETLLCDIKIGLNG